MTRRVSPLQARENHRRARIERDVKRRTWEMRQPVVTHLPEREDLAVTLDWDPALTLREYTTRLAALNGLSLTGLLGWAPGDTALRTGPRRLLNRLSHLTGIPTYELAASIHSQNGPGPQDHHPEPQDHQDVSTRHAADAEACAT